MPSPEPADVQFLLGRGVRTSYNVCNSCSHSCLHPGGPELLLTVAFYVLQPSLLWVILQTSTEASTTIWAKIIHTHMSCGYFEILFWNLLVCRGMNENVCTFSVLKSTGCISTCNFCMYKHMCASIQLCECTGISNLQHPVHITGSLNFKKQTEVIKMLLRRDFGGQCVLPPIQNGCLLPPLDQVRHDFVEPSPENLQGWRSHVPLGSLAPVLHWPSYEEVFPKVQSQLVSIACDIFRQNN